MKIQCNACGAAEATVLCCADEAALCWACDERVHAANKLAGKHQRIPLFSEEASGGAGDSTSSSCGVPKCDICQEASGYFFCLEDRALLCRKCDLAIHTANSYVSAHQRFLLTGVRVGLDATEADAPVAKQQLQAVGRDVLWQSKQLARNSIPMSSPKTNGASSSQIAKDGGLMGNKSPVSGFSMPGTPMDWSLDEYFGFPEFNQNFGFTEQNSSKADSGKLGSSEGSPLYCSMDDNHDSNKCLGEVPEFPWMVPEIPSPPTASGLNWQRNWHYPAPDNAAFVPDICSSHSPNYLSAAVPSKHRRSQQW
ncbi:B-box zinc finger protein 23 [Canna indica]|uniref:B-box zinc finger protein 23 n=1 Tax=Canna indica TaxID=4628 RepID=A0AAQ3K573_9LILI|nr:B-box zinc finger protein 23 [Canna indica]